MSINKQILLFRRQVYLSILFFLGILSFPFMSGCGDSGKSEADMKRINDSIANAHKLDSIVAKAKEDSTTAAQLLKARQDSVAKADSIANIQKQNNFIHNSIRTKYGLPTNFRN